MSEVSYVLSGKNQCVPQNDFTLGLDINVKKHQSFLSSIMAPDKVSSGHGYLEVAIYRLVSQRSGEPIFAMGKQMHPDDSHIRQILTS